MDGMGWPQDAAPSAHRDTFARDNLPPHEAWPELRFDLPELRYPPRLNAATALLAGLDSASEIRRLAPLGPRKCAT